MSRTARRDIGHGSGLASLSRIDRSCGRMVDQPLMSGFRHGRLPQRQRPRMGHGAAGLDIAPDATDDAGEP